MLKSIATLKQSRDIPAINNLIPYARSVGLEVIVDGDDVLTVLRHRDDNIGNYIIRAIHGGVVGALLEHAAIVHLLAETEAAVVPKIVNLSIDYLRPCMATDTFARGRVIRQGRRVANVRAEAWQESPEKPVAAAHAHFLLA
jgi:uncharacterized protein (TIGR00369 family)